MSDSDWRDQRRAQREEWRRTKRERKEAMRCQSTLAHAVRGPVTLITVGVLFAFQNFTPYGFDKTWPVILIVFGLLTLVGRGMAPVPPVAPYVPPPVPPYAPPSGPAAGGPLSDAPAPAGSYRQSSYAQPAASESQARGESGHPATQPTEPRAPLEASAPPEGTSSEPALDALTPKHDIFAPAQQEDKPGPGPQEGGAA
jgi:hypothetical protein